MSFGFLVRGWRCEGIESSMWTRFSGMVGLGRRAFLASGFALTSESVGRVGSDAYSGHMSVGACFETRCCARSLEFLKGFLRMHKLQVGSPSRKQRVASVRADSSWVSTSKKEGEGG